MSVAANSGSVVTVIGLVPRWQPWLLETARPRLTRMSIRKYRVEPPISRSPVPSGEVSETSRTLLDHLGQAAHNGCKKPFALFG